MEVSQALDKSEQFQSAFEATLEKASSLSPEVGRTVIRYCLRRQPGRLLKSVELLTPLLDAEDRTLRAEAAIAIVRLLQSARFYTSPETFFGSSENLYVKRLSDLNPMLIERLVEAVEKPPDGVEFLDVAMTLRQIADRKVFSDFKDVNDRLMIQLEKECQETPTILFQLKLAPLPAETILATQSYGSEMNAPEVSHILKNLATETHTLSRRTILTGLLLHMWRIGIPAERDEINERMQKLAESLPKQPGHPEVKLIAPDSESIGALDFLWPRDSSLRDLNDQLNLITFGPHPGTRLRTTLGGAAAAESKIFRELLGLLLGRG